MYIKLIGAALVIIGSGSIGFTMVANHKTEEKMLLNLVSVLDYMECELQYRLTPLPLLCKQAAGETSGILKKILFELSNELESQVSPNVSNCMYAAMARCSKIPPMTAKCLKVLGGSLGRFDLQGQLKGLESVRSMSRNLLKNLDLDKEVRRRSYQTLSLCAGAALAILLL